MRPRTTTLMLAATGMIAMTLGAIPLQTPAEPKIMAAVETNKIKPKSLVKGLVTLEFAEGLHGYPNPPEEDYQIPVKIVSSSKTLPVKVSYPKGTPVMVMGKESPMYAGLVKFPFTFTAPAKAGKYTLTLEVSYQQCDEQSCWPPVTKKVNVPFTVTK